MSPYLKELQNQLIQAVRDGTTQTLQVNLPDDTLSTADGGYVLIDPEDQEAPFRFYLSHNAHKDDCYAISEFNYEPAAGLAFVCEVAGLKKKALHGYYWPCFWRSK